MPRARSVIAASTTSCDSSLSATAAPRTRTRTPTFTWDGSAATAESDSPELGIDDDARTAAARVAGGRERAVAEQLHGGHAAEE